MLARGRSDDTLDTVRHRLVVYRESTTPLVEYYRRQGLLREVDGVGDIHDIHQRVVTALA
jgi:adenylate kinase